MSAKSLVFKTVFKTLLKTLFIASICVSSCKRDDGRAENDRKSDTSAILPQKVDEESIRNQGMKDPQTSDAFDPNVLQSYLPEFIKTFKGAPPSTGTGFKKGYSWTQVSRRYEIPTGDLLIMITDYADIEDFIQTKITQIKSPTTGTAGESVKNLNPGKSTLAYESWDAGKHSGRLEAVVAKRFYIEITGTNLPKEFSSMEDVLKEMNIERLAKFPAKK